MTEIKPRVDGDGVPWCDAGCPQAENMADDPYSTCTEISCQEQISLIGGIKVATIMDSDEGGGDSCVPAVRRMAVERDKLLRDNERARVMYEAEREKVEHYYNHLCTRGFDAPYTILPRSGHAVPTVNIEKLGELMDKHDRMVVELEAFERGRLLYHEGRGDYELVVNVGLTHDPKMTIHRFATIEAAIEALMAEREE